MKQLKQYPSQDYTGHIYGYLTVKKFLEYRLYSGHRRDVWLCQCKCGKFVETISARLKSGHKKSCGCLVKEKLKAVHTSNINPDAGFKMVLRDYKRGAKERGLSFDLSEEEVRNLTQQNCFYCGIKPSSLKSNNGHHYFKAGPYVYNGIDRIDNNTGYTKSNCVPCCTQCNFAKGSQAQKEFFQWIQRLITHKADLVVD